MLLHPLTNFEMQKYYRNEMNFNGVYSRNSLPRIRVGTYAINHYEYKSIRTHWMALYVNGNNIIYLIALELSIFQKKLKNS